MDNNIKMIIAYDGTAYLGWQKTDTGFSVEGFLQETVERILQHPVSLQAASRTDAGVHAQGQVVNFFTSKNLLHLDKLMHSLNCVLPKDIIVREMAFAAKNFHPTLDCKAKTYRYKLCYDAAQLPQNRLYSWHYPYSLNIENMKMAAKVLIGQHDFSSFCNVQKNAEYENYIREIIEINIEEYPGKLIEICITGNHFLYKMVRNIVGTLAYIGKGMIPLESIVDILKSHDRTKAGITAPAHGLTLERVIY